MASAIDDLKAQARVLHRSAAAGDPDALARLARAGIREAVVLRRHCLAALARELGFDGWPDLVHLVEGRTPKSFGTFLYPPRCSAHTNVWSASYDEARAIRAQHGGYLLAYRNQFLVVEDDFLATLGSDPSDPDWERIGRDWVRPADPEARARLCSVLIAARDSA